MLNIWIKRAPIARMLSVGSLGVAVALATGAVLPNASRADVLQLAQAASLEPQTISVMGQGQASAPADSAAIVFSYISNSYPEYSEETGAIVKPAALLEPDDLQSVVDAITAEGIAFDIDFSQATYDYQYLQMVVKLEQPTRDRVDKLKEVAAKAALADGQFSSSPVGVIYSTSRCESLEREARRAAILDARESAAELAEASGLGLGDLTAIAGGLDFAFYGPNEIGCVSDVEDVLNYGAQYGFGEYSTRNSEVTVSFGVYATYEVEE